MKDESNDIIRMIIRNDYLQPIWCNICNLYDDCSKCPLKEGNGLCYDSQDHDYHAFEKFLKGTFKKKPADELTEEQKNCPYCNEETLKYETSGDPIPEFGKGYAIEHGDIKAFIEKKDHKHFLSHNFTPNSSDYHMKIEINYCPICGRKLDT